MNKLQLFWLLRKNTKLSEKRHPMFEANQWGKFFGYIVVGFLAIEFLALGTFLGWIAAKEDVPEMIFIVMFFLLIIDFGGRFATQQTPLMLVKPYLLTPISKYTAIECFLISQVLDLGNLLWMVVFLPYAFIVWCGGLSGWATIGLLCLLHLMVVINSQWYLLVRTLVNQHILWWLLPAAVYGAIILPIIFLPDAVADQVFDFIDEEIFEPYALSWWAFLVLAIIFCGFFAVNRQLQMHLIYNEVSKKENTKMKHVSEFQALNRFGQIGEYLKLEIKSTMRNKAIRSRFIQGVCFISFFSLAISFGDIYNGNFSRTFLGFYAFIFFGAVNLTKVMCPEGNYIDLLMVHEENILTLLRAKYYYYCAILLIPVLLQLPPVITGKYSILMVLAFLFTATGPVYWMLFQLAVFNHDTLPLNDKITGKNQMENKWQGILSMVALFLPVVLVMTLESIFDSNTAYIVLIVIGLAFTLTEQYWMRDIYRRMMTRRYENLEGFHTTR